MDTKSHRKKKKKKSSVPDPSINAKAPSSDQKPRTSEHTEEREETAAASVGKPNKNKATNEIDDIFQANEIDDIFQATKSSSKKRKPRQQGEEEAVGAKRPKERPEEGKKSKKGKKGSKGKDRDTDDDEEGEEKRPRRRTADGLAIYSADELRFGKVDAGGTPLCPFDCDCCF
ncbi:hypothetical protein GUJ93_ZPchr0003g17155 [Zizania palustris]|uniref:DUF1764 domain-containing protein n=1 Tax=Zizania palustris TaxID=103762 RepID=A0A8J5SUY3_ZIZPA|nr:hypothetical protein GUJ93_ZPchr0003g17155 [Zizania palustris]